MSYTAASSGSIGVGLDKVPLLYSLAYYYLGYSLSPYAVICFITNMILNRVIVMTSIRSKSKNQVSSVRLPLWSRILFHSVIIVPLIVAVVQLLSELDYVSVFVKVSDTGANFLLTRILLMIAISNVIETFLSVTRNMKPMIDPDYSLLEISVQFYLMALSSKSMHSRYGFETQIHNQMLIDSLMIVSNHLLIHLLDMFNLRNNRLIISILMNIAYIYAAKANTLAIITVVPLCPTFLRIWFKFVPSNIISITVIYKTIMLVVKSKTGNENELKFFRNLWKFLKHNGQDECMMTSMKLAKAIMNTTNLSPSLKEDNNKTGPHYDSIFDETSENSNSRNVNGYSHIISGYLNKLKTSPEDHESANQTTVEPTQEKSMIQLNFPTVLIKFRISVEVFKKVILLGLDSIKFVVLYLFYKVKPKKEDVSKETKKIERIEKHFKDLNILITSKNYTKFLTRFVDPLNNSNCTNNINNNIYLLPDQDSSEDYKLPDDKDPESNNRLLKSHDKEAYFPTDINSMKDELVDLFLDFNHNMIQSTEHLNWYNSMYSILKYELANEKRRLTRSQYGKLNSEAILNEVVLERWSTNNYNNTDDADILDIDNDEEEEAEHDLRCAVCLHNVRNIVFWPCKCLAICDECRDALGSRGINTCIACKTEVEGYSKLNIV